jgi:hypothetical protein
MKMKTEIPKRVIRTLIKRAAIPEVLANRIE